MNSAEPFPIESIELRILEILSNEFSTPAELTSSLDEHLREEEKTRFIRILQEEYSLSKIPEDKSDTVGTLRDYVFNELYKRETTPSVALERDESGKISYWNW